MDLFPWKRVSSARGTQFIPAFVTSLWVITINGHTQAHSFLQEHPGKCDYCQHSSSQPAHLSSLPRCTVVKCCYPPLGTPGILLHVRDWTGFKIDHMPLDKLIIQITQHQSNAHVELMGQFIALSVTHRTSFFTFGTQLINSPISCNWVTGAVKCILCTSVYANIKCPQSEPDFAAAYARVHSG